MIAVTVSPRSRGCTVALPVPRDLPVLPGPRVRAMVVLWNPDAKIEHIVSVVEGDPALTAAMLRAANSALSAPIEPIRTAREAVLRMGWTTSRQIITAALANSEFDRLGESDLDVPDLWRHLLATGLLTEALATSPADRSHAFVAGLLHDIGRLSMAAQNPARYARVVELVRAGIPVDVAERRQYGMTHSQWGARVCRAWELPEAILEAASNHHRPQAEGIAGLVWQARGLSWNLGFGDGLVYSGQGEVEPEADSPTTELLASFGGRDGLNARIRWYREAFGPR